MKKIIEVEYPDHHVENELIKFIKELIEEDGRMKEGVFRSHIVIEHIPNK